VDFAITSGAAKAAIKISDISPIYRWPVLQAAGLSILLVILSMMVMDLGETLSALPLGLTAFWGVTVLIIFQRPGGPSLSDIRFIRFGSLWVFVLAQVLARLVWYFRGVQF
jgi:hypothetical protein